MNFKQLGSSYYLARYIFLNTVGVDDYKRFPARGIGNAPPVFHFLQPTSGDRLLPYDTILSQLRGQPRARSLDEFLKRSDTTAFLVIRHDRLLLERYYGGASAATVCTSFSTVKSFVSALVGIALDEGLIVDLDDPVTRYLPELAAPHWAPITLRHLVSMSSGLAYNERGFLPWNDQPHIYYTPDIRRLARRARSIEPPGVRFRYNNYNLVLLGMVLEKVTGGTVSAYLEEKIWKPLGMEYPAFWSLDSVRCGMEKMESGLNARAIDFAKFGRLYLRSGDWDGKQVVPERWVHESTAVEAGAKWSNYKYLWWIPRAGEGRFMAVGNLGQFIYLAPEKDCMILRFGCGKPSDWQRTYPQLFDAIVGLL